MGHADALTIFWGGSLTGFGSHVRTVNQEGNLPVNQPSGREALDEER
jgi:hypothetical protein